MGKLDGAWLACSEEMLWAFRGPGTGEAIRPHGRPHPEASLDAHCRILALAVRPPRSDPGSPRHVVILVSNRPQAKRAPGPGEGTYLCELGPDGRVTPIAGQPDAAWEAPREGPASRLCFSRWPVTSLALDRHGNLFVATRAGELMRVGVDGRVRMLAKAPGTRRGPAGAEPWTPVDGPLGSAEFGAITGLASDPDTDALYVLDTGTGHGPGAIRWVSPEGTVRTLAESGRPVGPEDAPGPAGLPNLGGMPTGLACHRGILYLCDPVGHRLLAFEPATGVLRTVAGDPGQAMVRPGPLVGFAPHEPAAACAALGEPRGVALAGATAMVCAWHEPRLLRLDVPEDAFRTVRGPTVRVVDAGEAKDAPLGPARPIPPS